MKLEFRFMFAIVLTLVTLPTVAFELKDCSELKWRRGKPYNYFADETRRVTGTFSGGLLYLVESAHFTDSVRTLTGTSTGPQPSDILFVLSTIPNHPAALDAYSRYETQYHSFSSFRQRKDTRAPEYKADCLISRAASLFPQYSSTFLVWGIHYFREKKFEAAAEKMLKALELEPDSAEIKYNLGLVYLELDKLDIAKKYASEAYSEGFPLVGLMNKIKMMEKKLGKGTD